MAKLVLGLVHTVGAVATSLSALRDELDPGVAIVETIDSALLQHVMSHG